MSDRVKRIVVNIVIAAVLLLVTAFLTVVMIKSKKTEDVAALEEPPVPVAVWHVKTTNTRDIIILPGVILPWEDVSVAAEQAGRIVSVRFDRGDRVSTNALLIQLDDRLQQHAVERAQLDLRDAERDLARWNDLRKTGSVSQKELDDITFRKEQAEVALKQARIVMDQCRVTSPIDGAVLERQVELGEYLSPGMPVARIVNASRVRVVVEVAERDVCRLSQGQHLRFAVDALAGRVFSGPIRFIAPAGSLGSNTFRVELEVPNDRDDLRPGYIVRLELDRGIYENAVVVPLDVLVARKGLYLAFVVEGGTVVRRVVRLTSIVESSAIVASGLEVGERLVVDGQRALADGMPVVVAVERE